ncbi:MAG TPA: hypothetical protein VFQ95_09230 [Rhodanobacteraceae bacterium]|nr:hypothetical protein [Rhodanobacteraceae bacterium]
METILQIRGDCRGMKKPGRGRVLSSNSNCTRDSLPGPMKVLRSARARSHSGRRPGTGRNHRKAGGYRMHGKPVTHE